MQNISDTIIACSSPLGRGAISLVRISGPDLTFLSQKLKIKNLVNKKAIVKVSDGDRIDFFANL